MDVFIWLGAKHLKYLECPLPVSAMIETYKCRYEI